MNSWKQYRVIRVWGHYLGSFDYYIQTEQRKAAEEDAPLDALYKDSGGPWVRKADLHDEHPFHAYVEAVTNAGLI